MPMTDTEKEICRAESRECGLTPCFEIIKNCRPCTFCRTKIQPEITMTEIELAQAALDRATANVGTARDELQRAEYARRTAFEALSAVKMRAAVQVPVDRTARTLTDGSPVTPDHMKLRPDGQQKAYVVLSEAERAKGFVRPVRDSYRHDKCRAVTTMGRSLAETYARDPFFYSGTFCATCCTHFPVGETGEFTWLESDGREIAKVGT